MDAVTARTTFAKAYCFAMGIEIWAHPGVYVGILGSYWADL